MQTHLFSSVGDPPLQTIVEISAPLLKTHPNPTVLYLPPTFKEEYIELLQQKFDGIATIHPIDLTEVKLDDFEQALEQAAILFIPGGNTYLLNFRLNQMAISEKICSRVKAGLPYIGISAGSLVCGANILTTNDINCCGSVYFNGFRLVEHNFVAHYPSFEGPERQRIDERIHSYHLFFENPVLALEEDAHLLISEKGLELVSGHCWLFRRNQEKVQVSRGEAF